MDANPILEGFWRIEDEFARQAGCDLLPLCTNTREWGDTDPRTGPVLHNAEELLQWMENVRPEQTSGLNLKEEPLKPDKL